VTKIGGDSIKPVVPGVVQDAGAADPQPVPQGSTAPSARTVKVEITALPAGQQLDKVLSGVGIVDAGAVEATKQAIIEGRFRVDAEVVARRLLATVREHLVVQQKS